MSSKTVTSPIIITSPGSTRIFRNEVNERQQESAIGPENRIIQKKSSCCRCCGCFRCCNYCRIPPKRFFLPLLSLLYFVSIENTQHYVFFPLIITTTAFIVFYNFPFLVYFSNTKPLYYEDLFIDTSSLPLVNLDDKIRKRFENTFEITLVTTNALLLGALSDYWIYRTEEKHAMIEVIGITGGILKIFQFINNVIGSFILYILSIKINRTVKKNKNKLENFTGEKLSGEKRRRNKRRNCRGTDFSKNIEMISIDDARHVINSPENFNIRLPIIKEDSVTNRYDVYSKYNNHQNFIVERIQLPDNIVKKTRRFKKISEMNRIEKIKQYDREEIERKEKLIRIKEDKFINRNILLTKDTEFQRVGNNHADSPHPLKHLAEHVKKQSQQKIEKNFNRINKADQKSGNYSDDTDCVIVDIPSPMSDTEIDNDRVV